MSVTCGGDCRLIENTEERQAFESELTRHGRSHDDYSLFVTRIRPAASEPEWSLTYTVLVHHRRTNQAFEYRGGSRQRWVKRFIDDLLKGRFEAAMP